MCKNKTRHSYMFPISGQTAGPNWLTFFVDTHGYPGGDKQIEYFFLTFFPRGTEHDNSRRNDLDI